MPNILDPDSRPSNVSDILFVWKEAQEMHRHFNTILFQIRNIAFVFAGATLGGVGALLKLQSDALASENKAWLDAKKLLSENVINQKDLDKFVSQHTELAGPLMLVAAIIWLGLYLLDRYYYHVLLIGATKYVAGIEEQWIDLGLSKTIRDTNRSQPFPLTKARQGRQKITVFYAIPLSILVFFGTYRTFENNLYISILALVITWLYLFISERFATS